MGMDVPSSFRKASTYARVSTYMQGGEEIAAAFGRMGGAARKLAQGALKAGGVPITAAVLSHIHDVSGLLRLGTRVRAGRGDRPGRYSVYMSSQTTARRYASYGRRRKVAAGMGSGSRRYRIWHWPAVEFGHRIVTKGGRDTGKRVEAHPFIRPGFDQSVGGAMDIVEEQVLDGVMAEF